MIRPSNRRIALDDAPKEGDASRGGEPEAASPRRGKADAPAPRAARSRAASGSMARLVELGRALLGLVLVVGIAGGVAHAARRYVKTTPRFAVTDIVVVGASHRSEDDLIAIAGVAKGKNVFSTDLDAARAHLLADPWIKEARLERRLPGTVSIVVEERRAAGIVAAGDTYLVSADGEIWKRLEPGDPTDSPIITGLSLTMVTQDRKGAEAVVRRALELGLEYERSPLAKRSPLQEIHVAPTGRTALVVGKSALTLELGAPPFRRKLEHAARVIADLDRRGAKADALLLDDEARLDRVVVRMR